MNKREEAALSIWGSQGEGHSLSGEQEHRQRWQIEGGGVGLWHSWGHLNMWATAPILLWLTKPENIPDFFSLKLELTFIQISCISCFVLNKE